MPNLSVFNYLIKSDNYTLKQKACQIEKIPAGADLVHPNPFEGYVKPAPRISFVKKTRCDEVKS